MLNKSIPIQFIENKGKPEWAVLPYEEYLRLRELDEISREVHRFKKALAQGQEELIPQEYADRLIEGENPVRVWRTYRGITQADLAKKVSISVPYLSQIEHEERTASTGVLKKIAKILAVTLDDLV